MNKILEFLARQGAFLYRDFDFRICHSTYDPAFGGGGSVTLRNDVVELRIWTERDRLFMDLRGLGQQRPESWFSLDILRQLSMGMVVNDASLNDENTEFLRENLGRLLVLFAPDHLAETERKCKELEQTRAERLFG